jgi:SAM-dependent methyltransferase
MTGRDAFRFINELDETILQSFINRLEFRGKDPTFVQWREAYLDTLPLATAPQVLDLGCGTGVVARALAKREGFSGRVIGVDQSPVLIDAARRLAAEEQVEQHLEFQVGDVHTLDYADSQFSAVVAHTLMSHVTDPLTVLKEAARVVTLDGVIVLFDGDYASWTFSYPDAVLAKAMEEALVAAVVNNPRVMRDMPRLLQQAGLERIETLAYVYADIGAGQFYAGAIEAYAPLVVRAGLLPAEQVEMWLREQRRAQAEGTAFGACNYYTYIARRAKTE